MSDRNQSAPVLTADEVYKRFTAIHEFSEDHDDEWRNQIARDLNYLVRRAGWETDGHLIDNEFGSVVLRIVERVAESEGIKAKGKPSE